MKITCEYCGGYLQDTDESCPHCAAVNKNVMRSADGIPKTIAQLKAFAEEKKLPLQQMRFFIGENITEPRAFGIYKDEAENFVVYKNKSDGTRVVRYEGKDEAYAVNELYQKMRTEVMEQKAHQAVNSVHGKQPSQSTYTQTSQNYANHTTMNMGNTYSSRRRKKKNSLLKIIFLIIILLIFLTRIRNSIFDFMFSSVSDYGSAYDVFYGDYDDYDDYDYDDDYDDYDSWADDWDDDDWDFGGDSWDSGYTDWDSDW